MAFTKYAINSKIVRVSGSATYWEAPPNGNYRTTGRDINGRSINRNYVVNNRIDRQSIWSMWHDFNGRWGLTRIWYIDDEGKRHLIWRE